MSPVLPTPERARRNTRILRPYGPGLLPRAPGAGGGGDSVEVESYYHQRDSTQQDPLIGSGAYESTLGNFGDGGGFAGADHTPDPDLGEYGYGGPTQTIHMSFWVRFIAQPNIVGYDADLVVIGRHNSSDHYCGIQTKQADPGNTGRLNLEWAKISPFLSKGGVSFDADNASVSKMFSTSTGEFVLDKWMWVHARLGLSPSILILDEESALLEATPTLLTNWDGGSASNIAVNDGGTAIPWRAEVGSEVASSTASSYSRTAFDLCNLRVGYIHAPTENWWTANFWKRQIDITAERALQVTSGRSELDAKKQLCYGYPFQAAGSTQSDSGPAGGPDFTLYSGTIEEGTGPVLLGAYVPE